MAKHTSWHSTQAQADAAVQAARDAGTLLSEAVEFNGTNYTTTLDLRDASWAGLTGRIELVTDLHQDDGRPNYQVWIGEHHAPDSHVAGSFATVAAAQRWAKKEGVRLQAGVRRVKTAR